VKTAAASEIVRAIRLHPAPAVAASL